MQRLLAVVVVLSIVLMQVQVFGRVRKIYDLNFDLAQQAIILNKHNQVRATIPAANMQTLVWNPTLANVAKDWASQCRAVHRPLEGRSNQGGFQYIGENIWWFQSESFPNLETVVQNLFDEYPYYDFNTNGCQWGQQCGHYVQIAWADTCAVGCGVALCDQMYNANIAWGHIVVCNYGPAYAYPYQKPYVSGRQCSSCPGQCQSNGLCANRCYITPTPTQTPAPAPAPKVELPEQKIKPAVENPVPVAQQQQCQNNQQDCEYWASIGECTVNPLYMQYQCKKSCGIAPCPIRSLPSPPVPLVKQPPVEPANVITPITDPNCRNTHELCDFWASNFQCEANPAYMLTVCREACLQCARGGWISTGQRCADDNADCGYWALTGECSTNRYYMRWKCKQSCGLC